MRPLMMKTKTSPFWESVSLSLTPSVAKLGSACKTYWLPRFKIACFVQNFSPETTNLRWQLSTPFQVVGHLRLNFKMHLFQVLKLPRNIRLNAATAKEFSISGTSLKAMIEFSNYNQVKVWHFSRGIFTLVRSCPTS